MDIDVAERLIDYKIKMSEQWLESKQTNKKKVESDSEDEEELPKPSKTNKK